MKKTYRIKTNNQEQLQRKQNESDATSRWIEFQKTRPRRRIQDKDVPVMNKYESWMKSLDWPLALILIWTTDKKSLESWISKDKKKRKGKSIVKEMEREKP